MSAVAAWAGFINPANWGPMELSIVLVIVLLVFGPKKLPSLGQSIGKSIKEFRDGIKGINRELSEDDDARRRADLDPKPAPPVAKSAEDSSKEE
ncbi:MAG: Sec-independent protein translocase protein TatAy [candidate division BRC1 bacterium ADurb.BinA364]|nr:MAG: Sec-independent protein translocase protein TatAy [candidate division BRC1 bacterium ADurb.BinA364]